MIDGSTGSRGLRLTAVRLLGIASLLLAPGWASSGEVEPAAEEVLAAPPEPSLTFNEDVMISKNAPTLTLVNATVSPFKGFFVQLESEGNVAFQTYSSAGTSRMLDYRPATKTFTFWGNPGIFGRVGIGAGANPSATLHVRGGQGDTRVLVEETSSTVIGRNLLRLVNNGPATFRFENSSNAVTWAFGSIAAQDKFFISQSGAAGLDLTLDGAGNLTILGTLTQLSDRNAKRDVEAADGRALLAKVAALPVSTWSYKADASGTRHIGPMAQDFAASFGLGADDTHVAPSDVAGVGLAAVQALKRENDELRAALGRLRSQLTERLDALESRAGR